MIIQILSQFFSASCMPAEDVKQNANESETLADNRTDMTNPDIQVLDKKFGLTNGTTIEISLKDALSLMPRTRRRSDAYRSLISELQKDYNVRLIVGKTKMNKKK